MKKNTLLFLLIVVIASTASSQNIVFADTLPSLWVEQLSDSGYIVVGDSFLRKIDSNGAVLWKKQIVSSAGYGNYVQPTVDGGYIISGNIQVTSTSNSGEMYLVKTNSSGDTLWSKIFGGTNYEEAHAVIEDSNGNYLIVGETNSFGTSNPNYSDVYLVKTNSNGDTLWTKTYGGSSSDAGYSIIQTNGDYLIAGRTVVNNYNNGYLLKINNAGNLLWSKLLGNSTYSALHQIKKTTDGGYIIVGTSDANSPMYLAKLDSNADTLWTKTFGPFSSWGGDGFSVDETNDGGFIVGGALYPGGPPTGQNYLAKTDSNGNIQWELKNNIAGYWNSGVRSVHQTYDNGYIIGTWAFLIKTDSLNIAATSNISASSFFNIYPNPTQEYVVLDFHLNSPNISIKLYDLLGKEKCIGKPFINNNEQLKINLSFLPAGIYFLKLETYQGVEVKKIIKY